MARKITLACTLVYFASYVMRLNFAVMIAKIYTEMGFYLGIGGVLTYRNSRKLKKVVSRIPLERLVLETDCPYLAPEPHRGERNDSRYLREVVRAIAEIKETDEMTVEHVTWENACRLFSIAPPQ